MSLLVMTISLSIISINCSEVKLQHTISDNSEIRFVFQEINTTDFIVEKNKPLDIVLDNYFAKYVWCLNFYYTGPDDIFVEHVAFDGSSDSVLSISKVMDNMITKWWCVVLQEQNVGKPYSYCGRNYTAQNIVFALSAKDERPTFVLKLIYTISAIFSAFFIVIITILIRKCCCTYTPLKPLPIDPASVFYVNLEIFRRQYEMELQAQEEPQYEEID